MKILICGDSFAADWSVKYPGCQGWPNLLAQKYNVVNCAQAGISEYKVVKQLESVKDIDMFDLILISHCNPWRIHTREHPIHNNDVLHKNSDLIFSDIEHHVKSSFFKSLVNKSLLTAYNFFVYHYEKEYQEAVYQAFRYKIAEQLKNKNSLVLVFDKQVIGKETNMMDFSNLFEQDPGSINHLSEESNKIVFDSLVNMIER
jgi:hypothetical protein